MVGRALSWERKWHSYSGTNINRSGTVDKPDLAMATSALTSSFPTNSVIYFLYPV